jgi:hypothetical protein
MKTLSLIFVLMVWVPLAPASSAYSEIGAEAMFPQPPPGSAAFHVLEAISTHRRAAEALAATGDHSEFKNLMRLTAFHWRTAAELTESRRSEASSDSSAQRLAAAELRLRLGRTLELLDGLTAATLAEFEAAERLAINDEVVASEVKRARARRAFTLLEQPSSTSARALGKSQPGSVVPSVEDPPSLPPPPFDSTNPSSPPPSK